MAGTSNPWMKMLELTSHTAIYQLLALMQALDSSAPDHFQAIQIQVREDAGAAKVFIGNSDLTAGTTGGGVTLFATQAFGFQDVGGNRIDAKQIYLTSDTDAVFVKVTALRM
jgi:hypothetical protein